MLRGNRVASVRAFDRRDGISGRLGRRRGPSDVDIHGVLGDTDRRRASSTWSPRLVRIIVFEGSYYIASTV